MATSRQTPAPRRLKPGDRVRWPDESAWGTVIKLVWAGSSKWHVCVDWDEGAPTWWANDLPAAARLEVEGQARPSAVRPLG